MVRIAEVRSVPVGGSTCSSDPSSQCGNGLEKIYPTTVVRFGYMKHIGEFNYKPGMKFTCGGKVVIQTSRGIEIGQQVSLTCTGCSKSLSREQMRSYAQASGEGFLDLECGRVLREATAEDLHEERHLRENAKLMLKQCKKLVTQHELPMKLVECEHLFGGERVIFYFMSESRIDFRELVKDLAHEFHTRIEMRQVGARDEARLVADYETCGQQCCCKTFLKTLKPISMRMAKMQKATLDPSKVSGRCGRLKCCLRYEHETYEELDKKLPSVGQQIRTVHGDGVVVDRQILTQLVQIETQDQRILTVVVEDILGREPETPTERAALTQETVKEPTKNSVTTGVDMNSEEIVESTNSESPGMHSSDSDPAADRKGSRRRRRRRRSHRGGDSGAGASPNHNDVAPNSNDPN